MDVKQPDGQVLTATITKLTDQSTYTVGESAVHYHALAIEHTLEFAYLMVYCMHMYDGVQYTLDV